MIYDAAIIGTGPAGLSAALTLKAKGKSFLWIGSRQLSDKVAKAEQIANYPGLPMITGREMNAVFFGQCQELGIEILDRMVNSIMPFGDHYALMAGEDFHESYTVLLATGVTSVGLLPGEAELVGRGVSYCATCDGGLYRGRTVGVLCANRRFEHEVAFLAGLADKVYFLPLYDQPGAMPENVQLLPQRITALASENGRLKGLVLKDGSEIPVNGLFCLRDSVSLATLLPGLATEQGHIAVNREMQTNLPGVYAAGDCTGRPYQYAKAVGEGNVAAHSMADYLDRKNLP